MADDWIKTVPVLDRFLSAADPSRYVPLPDDWLIGITDVVDSTKAIEAGRYKAVNLAGASSISAVANARGGSVPLFVFGGDGVRFVIPPADRPAAADALARAAMWVRRELNLELRVGMTRVARARAAGFDARVALWQASDHVRYAMFTGGAMEWADAQLKRNAINLAPGPADHDPDLAGLSCRWGPLIPTQGVILSLIVKQVSGVPEPRFADLVAKVLAALGDTASLNPVPEAGPNVDWLSTAIAFHSETAREGQRGWWRCLPRIMTTTLVWATFRLGLRIGRFDPDRYRREMAVNTDFRKFDDGLMLTVDCSEGAADRLSEILEDAVGEGVIRYGLHRQNRALITCIVPSAADSDHMHFVDGAGGGYAAAAKQMRGP